MYGWCARENSCNGCPEYMPFDEYIVSKNKEIPVKPYEGHYEEPGEKPYIKYRCPCCNSRYQLSHHINKYCSNCGQKIDWSDLFDDDEE